MLKGNEAVIEANSMGTSQKVISIYEELDPGKKLEVMMTCDSAFDIPLMHRAGCDTLLEKISTKAIVLVACCKEPIGYAAMYANDLQNKTAFITMLAIRPELQGMRIGRRLLLDCEAKALENGMRHIRLEVAKGNDRAIRLYQKCGFQIHDESKSGFYMMKAL